MTCHRPVTTLSPPKTVMFSVVSPPSPPAAHAPAHTRGRVWARAGAHAPLCVRGEISGGDGSDVVTSPETAGFQRHHPVTTCRRGGDSRRRATESRVLPGVGQCGCAEPLFFHRVTGSRISSRGGREGGAPARDRGRDLTAQAVRARA